MNKPRMPILRKHVFATCLKPPRATSRRTALPKAHSSLLAHCAVDGKDPDERPAPELQCGCLADSLHSVEAVVGIFHTQEVEPPSIFSWVQKQVVDCNSGHLNYSTQNLDSYLVDQHKYLGLSYLSLQKQGWSKVWSLFLCVHTRMSEEFSCIMNGLTNWFLLDQ